jgi:hypothetical protein
MRIVFALLIALFIDGCASPGPVPLSGATPAHPPQLVAFATLAEKGTFSEAVAPAITRLALQRHRAAALLREGRITVDTAKEVQAQADQARALLETVYRSRTATPEARAALAQAAILQGHIDTLLK